jgi:hypothetical protein
MSTVKWSPGVKLDVDPDAILDFTLDFTAWLEGNTISSASVIAVGCTANVTLQDTTSVRFRASAFVGKGQATIRVNCADGQRDDFTIKFNAKSK